MSIVSRSLALRTLAALAVAGGLALAAPGPARADSFSFGVIVTDGDRHGHGGRRHWRGDRGHHRDGNWRGHRRGGDHWRGHRRGGDHWRGHRRHGPPPWAYSHRRAPHGWRRGHAYVRHCQVVWSNWHGGFVRICR